MLILASSSPRRKEILSKYVKQFTIVKPDVDESVVKAEPFELPKIESRLKADVVRALYPNDPILACDTIVLLDNKVLGKPHDKDTAIKMLKQESGKTQIVISGYTFISNDKIVTRSVTSKVVFKELTNDQIIKYVDEYKPFDKAGAYGIQDDFPLIERIEGSYYNVMGLPIEDILANCPLKYE